MSIEESDLFEGLIKSLSILFGHLPFEVLGILHLGVKHLFELVYLSGVEILMVLELFLQGGNLVLEFLLLSLLLFLLSQVLVLGLFDFFLREWISLA